MTRYATAFKGLRIVTLDHRNNWKKNRKIQDALKSIRNGKLCSTLNTYAREMIKSADIVLLAYNSAGEVRGVVGVDEFAYQLYVSIICNDMEKENRGRGYAPGKGLLDLLKKIAVRRRKNVKLDSVKTAVNYYKRFGFKQDPSSNRKTALIWSWRPSYSRPRRFEYESVNSNYNSNNNRSSATVKKNHPNTKSEGKNKKKMLMLKKNIIKSKMLMLKKNIITRSRER